jgi:hypothetical protein
MSDLVELLALQPLLKAHGLDAYTDFELLYDTISRDPALADLGSELDRKVRHYFGNLVIPPGPTAYDYLLLGLREKDVVATFNWDPLLLQVYRRHVALRRLPQILFLHGSVAVGVCQTCQVKGNVAARCAQCRNALVPTRLLYPIADKDYVNDPFIVGEWEALRESLRHAYFLTIFGYGAPQSDAAAIDMLKSVWRDNESRTIAEVELIDTRKADEVWATWQAFITRQHWMHCDDIRDSFVAWHPRRSCEALAFATLQNDPWAGDWMPRAAPLAELVDWVRPLIGEEEGVAEGRSLSGCGRRADRDMT